ncbi:hypothetical protein Ga0466249_001420 [Sporomusaceae bacterium BoRhaA]|uniref:hypothetical protein n=1 Tax=Pelorhabdus rhamnosifermentans TaxID=2772457 RepID=UPI001C0635D2|nr:hypothetical protein [Pelorhabdus rhamnosifermentans]MBU2700328.1 hypothetical protein [Pelorhabdus rhamnosifermentans]
MKEGTLMRSKLADNYDLSEGVTFHLVHNLYLNGRPMYLVHDKSLCHKTKKSSLWRRRK